MKPTFRQSCGVFIGLLFFVTSCVHVTRSTATREQRFQEADAADLVLRFYSWDSIYVIKPDSRESGFMPLFNRASVGEQLDRPQTKRDLVVVIIGNNYSSAQQEEVLRDWKTLLDVRGFRRAVFLSGTGHKSIDGLPILRDTAAARI